MVSLANSLRDPRYRAFVARLIAARKQLGLNQRQLAERLEKPQSYVARVELHERRLDVVQLVEWVQALELEQRAFFDDVVTDVLGSRKRKKR